jgi:hypothetical protein
MYKSDADKRKLLLENMTRYNALSLLFETWNRRPGKPQLAHFPENSYGQAPSLATRSKFTLPRLNAPARPEVSNSKRRQ